MNQFLRAESGEGIFWTIMIIIWIVSKATAASRKANKKAPPPAPRVSKPKLPPQELQAFLDSLTGGRETRPRATVQIPTERRSAPSSRRIRRESPTVHKPPAAQPAAVAEVQIGRQMSLLNTSVRDLITDIPSARMPNLSIGFFSPQSRNAPREKPNLRNHSELRKAMLGHVILSRPPSAGW
ncbi:MAG TPA: hypothetical protein PKK36_00715 [Kiritimatiellia bacterium]|nr:hypothetical protein [Kiritimatiellia bacterium]